jgi:hypothetical protein
MLQGPSSLVGLPLDAATAAYNLATGQQLRQPSEAISQSLTQVGFPEPQNLAETGMTAAAGGLPEIRAQLANLLPKSLRNVPASFQGEQSMQDLLLAEARDAGYVVPPATVGRSTVRETVAGKVRTQQAAAEANQQVTNKLAARTLGIPEDKPLSLAAVKEVMDDAGRVYEKVKTDRRFVADDQYKSDLAKLESETLEISKDFPDLKLEGMAEISNLVKGLNSSNFSAKSLVDLVKRLRSEAKNSLSFNNTDSADRALGRAKLDAAETLEDLMSRELVRQGDMSLFQEFNAARVLLAKAHTVDAAINPATGNVIAAKLAENLRRRSPLSGELSLAARFGNAFPSAAQELKSSPVNAMDASITALLGAGLGSLPLIAGASSPYAVASALSALTYPGARYAARKSLLSEGMQDSLVRRPRAEGGLLGPVAGAAAAAEAPASPQQQTGLPAGFVLMDEEEERRRIRSPLSRIVPQPAGR